MHIGYSFRVPLKYFDVTLLIIVYTIQTVTHFYKHT